MYLEIEYVLRGFVGIKFIVTGTQHQEDVYLFISRLEKSGYLFHASRIPPVILGREGSRETKGRE